MGKSGRLKTQTEVDAIVQVQRQTAGRIPEGRSVFLVRPSPLRRGICLMQSLLIYMLVSSKKKKKHLDRNISNNTWSSIYIPWPSQADAQTQPSQCSALFPGTQSDHWLDDTPCADSLPYSLTSLGPHPSAFSTLFFVSRAVLGKSKLKWYALCVAHFAPTR